MTKDADDKDKKGNGNSENGPGNEIDNLKVDVSKGQSWTRFLTIEVPSTKVDAKFQEVFGNFRQKAEIPGFRPGKAPMNIIEKKYDANVKAEVLESLVDEAYRQALIKEQIWPLADPKVSEVEFERSKPLKFKAEIEIRPEIKLKKYKGFRVEKTIRKVAEKDVDDSIEYMRENMADFEIVERPAIDGDQVKIDLLVKSDKLNRLKEDKLEGVELILGNEGILKEFQEALPGMGLGEMKDVTVIYPQDYQDPNLAGDEITYTAVVKEVKKRNLPEVNDGLVSKVSSHKTVDDFRKMLRENLEKQAENDATKALRSDIIRKVVESNSFDVPISLVTRYLDSVVEDHKSKGENVDENTIRSQYRPLGENLIRWNFLFHEIAGKENITVTTDDRAKWVHDFSVAHNISPEKAREILGRSGRQSDIDDSILEGKVLEYIIENSEIIKTEK
jgi:trigger factor